MQQKPAAYMPRRAISGSTPFATHACFTNGVDPEKMCIRDRLYGESEGKDGKGLFPASVVFSTDLHSMGQYIQDLSLIHI